MRKLGIVLSVLCIAAAFFLNSLDNSMARLSALLTPELGKDLKSGDLNMIGKDHEDLELSEDENNMVGMLDRELEIQRGIASAMKISLRDDKSPEAEKSDDPNDPMKVALVKKKKR